MWGYEGSGCCQFCQEPDTLAHRLLRCGYEPAVRVRGSISEGLLGRWQAAVNLDPAAEVGLALATLGPHPFDTPTLAELGITQSEHVLGYHCVGLEAPLGAVCSFRAADGPIFSDGSATHARSEFAAASFSAVQIGTDGTVLRGVVGRAPPELAQERPRANDSPPRPRSTTATTRTSRREGPSRSSPNARASWPSTAGARRSVWAHRRLGFGGRCRLRPKGPVGRTRGAIGRSSRPSTRLASSTFAATVPSTLLPPR